MESMEQHPASKERVVHTRRDLFRLYQNMPNPFSDQTVIAFQTPLGSTWRVRVENKQGKAVRTFEGNEGGTMTLSWDGTDDSGVDVQSGTYLCLLESDGRTDMRKMILIR
jgi:hypothetical protein